MAIAGGATTAYLCRLEDGELQVSRTTTLRTRCASVADAVRWMGEGQHVVVAGSDMAALRARLAQAAVLDDGPASLNEVINEHYPEDWE